MQRSEKASISQQPQSVYGFRKIFLTSLDEEVSWLDLLQAALAQSNVPAEVHRFDQLQLALHGNEHTLTVSLAARSETCESFEIAAETLGALKAHWVHGSLGEGMQWADISPLFGPFQPTCPMCYWAVNGSDASTCLERSSKPPLLTVLRFLAHIASELKVFYLHGPKRVSRPRVIRHMFELGEITSLPAPTLPNCRSCGLRDDEQTSMPLPVYFELSLKQVWVPPSSTQSIASSARFQAIQHDVGGIRATLSPLRDVRTADAMTHAVRPFGESVTLAQRATLFNLSAGFQSARRGTAGKRWAPTGGNLGSVQPWYLGLGDAGAPSRLYRYNAEDQEFERFERQDFSLSSERSLADGVDFCLGSRPLAIIVLVGLKSRVSSKYGPFGYRLLHFDAGVAMAQMSCVAHAIGLQVEVGKAWSDSSINEQLGLRREQSFCTSVLGLFSGNIRAQPINQQVPDFLPNQSRPVREYSGLTSDSLEALMIHASDFPGTYRSGHIRHNDNMQALNGVETVESLPLAEVLRKRYSCRDFSNWPVDNVMLNSILRIAYSGVEESLGIQLCTAVVARAVLRVEPGVYYTSTGLSMARTGVMPSSELFAKVFVQATIATAPVTFIICADLASVEHSFNYRKVLVAAGNLAHRLNLVAVSYDLNATISAGLYHDALERCLPGLSLSRCPLLAVSIGYRMTGEIYV